MGKEGRKAGRQEGRQNGKSGETSHRDRADVRAGEALKPGSAAGAAGVEAWLSTAVRGRQVGAVECWEVGDVIVAIDDTPVAGYLERKCCF